jgi:hypothetical protein
MRLRELFPYDGVTVDRDATSQGPAAYFTAFAAEHVNADIIYFLPEILIRWTGSEEVEHQSAVATCRLKLPDDFSELSSINHGNRCQGHFGWRVQRLNVERQNTAGCSVRHWSTGF